MLAYRDGEHDSVGIELRVQERGARRLGLRRRRHWPGNCERLLGLDLGDGGWVWCRKRLAYEGW